MNGDDISRGRVIYCYQGNWWSVCASDWGGEEARVVCNTLGYDTAVFGEWMAKNEPLKSD